MDYRTLNPASGELIESFAVATADESERVLEQGAAAFRAWRRESIGKRALLVDRLAAALQRRSQELAGIMAIEMGKPILQGAAEADKCAWVCRYFAQRAAEMLREQPRSTDGSESFVRFDPLGQILAIMPWNSPFWQFFRFAAPALMAGNTVLLKHAPNTPRCARAIERLVAEAGFPGGAVQSLFLDNDQVARTIGDDRVHGVTFTGSSLAGSQVAATAGRHLRPAVMELGGSDPFIVLEDADLDCAVQAGVDSRCQNSGQSCIAAQRFLVHRNRFDEFKERFVQAMLAQVNGDPTESGVTIGPLAREDLRDRLARQVRQSLDAGAEAYCGGAAADGPGFFYPATVLTGVEPGMPAADEELFGPVATLASFRSDEAAVQLANNSRYGLGASVWTDDVDRGRLMAVELEAGSVFINGVVKSDPRLPFGGIKQSGFGRELSCEGLLEFTNTKTVWIR